jgi:hypothetical protein
MNKQILIDILLFVAVLLIIIITMVFILNLMGNSIRIYCDGLNIPINKCLENITLVNGAIK